MAAGVLRDWAKGNRLSASHLQEPVNVLRKFLALPDALVAKFGDGAARPVYDIFLGKVVTSGPNSEADYTDERYWVKPQYIVGGDTSADPIDTDDITPDTLPDEAGGQIPDTLTVTNIAEWLDGSHQLRSGALVFYIGIYDWQEQSIIRWVMNVGGPTGVIPVSLATDGGTNGDASSAPSYTYTVTPIGGGSTIATAASPQVARPTGTATAASYGLGYYTGGTFSLLYAFEIPGSSSCPAAAP
jgi:hypothetical protein